MGIVDSDRLRRHVCLESALCFEISPSLPREIMKINHDTPDGSNGPDGLADHCYGHVNKEGDDRTPHCPNCTSVLHIPALPCVRGLGGRWGRGKKYGGQPLPRNPDWPPRFPYPHGFDVCTQSCYCTQRCYYMVMAK